MGVGSRALVPHRGAMPAAGGGAADLATLGPSFPPSVAAAFCYRAGQPPTPLAVGARLVPWVRTQDLCPDRASARTFLLLFLGQPLQTGLQPFASQMPVPGGHHAQRLVLAPATHSTVVT